MMRSSLRLIAALAALALPAAAQPQQQPVLCAKADMFGGAIVGLASDEVHHVRLPSDGGPGGSNPEKWTMVTERPDSGPQHSFTGKYAQVLPDDHDTYHDIFGPGSFTMTGLDWAFDVDTPGLHTLFVRWTAGDMVGGGDSFYVLVRQEGTDKTLPGPDTLRPKMVPIDAVPGQFTGCCYDPSTHACPCYTPDMNQTELCSRDADPVGYWVSIERGRMHGGRGRTCKDVHGELEPVVAPGWFLFSGQDVGNVQDFSAKPWDATCEAEGTSTADSGVDFAQWELEVGRYHMVFYPREDGTAIDAFYLTPPGAKPPTDATVLSAGASSIQCPGGPRKTNVAVTGQVIHRDGDAKGWGRRDGSGGGDFGGDGSQDGAQAGATCGLCLVPINASACPSPEELNSMRNCDSGMLLGELCEADGECGTNVRINNCINDLPDPCLTDADRCGGSGPRVGSNRNNDVYKRIPCGEWEALMAVGSDGGGLGTAVLIIALMGLLGGFGYKYISHSRQNHGGLIVMPWKLFAGPRAQTSSSFATSGGVGPLAGAEGGGVAGVGSATPYMAPYEAPRV